MEMPLGRATFETLCPAALSAGAPCDAPASWPRIWSAPGGGSFAAEAVPTPAARAITAMPTAMRWRFMIFRCLLVSSLRLSQPRRAGAPGPLAGGTAFRRQGRRLAGTFETGDDAHQS